MKEIVFRLHVRGLALVEGHRHGLAHPIPEVRLGDAGDEEVRLLLSPEAELPSLGQEVELVLREVS